MSVDQLAEYCTKRGYVSEKQVPWLCYALKKRVCSLIISFPILILASYLATPVVACSFYFSFCWLRSRTNGIHAKTFVGCMVASLLCVLIFMGPIYRLLTDSLMLILILASTIIIWFLAPFNHPNMHLTNKEKVACMQSARCRLVLLLLGIIILKGLHQQKASVGIILGIAMAALLLALAYLFTREEGGHNGKQLEDGQND